MKFALSMGTRRRARSRSAAFVLAMWTGTALGVLAALAAGPARADESAAPVLAQPTRALDFGAPVSEAALADNRGGDVQVNDSRLRATLGDNSASNLSTGMNAISEGSFGQASGFPMVIQNTGNNVIIQNSTILNLTVK